MKPSQVFAVTLIVASVGSLFLPQGVHAPACASVGTDTTRVATPGDVNRAFAPSEPEPRLRCPGGYTLVLTGRDVAACAPSDLLISPD